MFKNTNESFQKRHFIHFFNLGQKLPELTDLYFQIYWIKADFFGSFNSDIWPFWRPLWKYWVQYLIWKLSLVVLNFKEGIGMAGLLHNTKLVWKVAILLHTEAYCSNICFFLVYLTSIDSFRCIKSNLRLHPHTTTVEWSCGCTPCQNISNFWRLICFCGESADSLSKICGKTCARIDLWVVLTPHC